MLRQPSRVTSANGHIQYHSNTHVNTSKISTTNARADASRMGSMSDRSRSPAIRHSRTSSQPRYAKNAIRVTTLIQKRA